MSNESIRTGLYSTLQKCVFLDTGCLAHTVYGIYCEKLYEITQTRGRKRVVMREPKQKPQWG